MSPSYSFLYEYREVMFRAAEGARDCKHSTHLAQAFLTRSSWPLFVQMYVYMYAYTDAGDCFYVFLCLLSFARLCLWVLQHKLKTACSPPKFRISSLINLLP